MMMANLRITCIVLGISFGVLLVKLCRCAIQALILLILSLLHTLGQGKSLHEPLHETTITWGPITCTIQPKSTGKS